jgi:hypothetical protein
MKNRLSHNFFGGVKLRFLKNQITRQIKIRKINKKYDDYKLIYNYLKGHG